MPVLLLSNGNLVRSHDMRHHRIFGRALEQGRRFSSWQIDELIYVDISKSSRADPHRRDLARVAGADTSTLLGQLVDICSVPLTWGGGIRAIHQVEVAFDQGVDRVLMTSALLDDPRLVTEASTRYGSQAVCVGIDVRRINGEIRVFTEMGSKMIDEDLSEVVRRALDSGAGEILLHCIDRDGSGEGYDIRTLEWVLALTDTPVTVLGGAGRPEHLVEAALAGASGVAAANLWHFTDNVDRHVRSALMAANLSVRIL